MGPLPQAEALREDTACLVQWLNARSDVPVVLVVDQFEEVFTLCQDATIRDAFAATLVNLVQTPGPRHTVILTMREDFIERAGSLPIPPDLFQGPGPSDGHERGGASEGDRGAGEAGPAQIRGRPRGGGRSRILEPFGAPVGTRR